MSITALMWKEFRELLMERTIIIGIVLMPLIIFPLMGGALSLASRSTSLPSGEIPILLIDEDNGKYSMALENALKTAGFRPVTVANTRRDVISLINDHKMMLAIVIGKGFSQNLTDGRKAAVGFFTSVTSISSSELQKISATRSRVSAALAFLAEALASEKGVQLSFYKEPVEVVGGLIYKDKVVSLSEKQTVIQLYLSTSVLIPLVLLIAVVTSGTIAATSIGLEKEAKTLEILLTLPISRIGILSAKLLASSAIVLLGTAAMIVGFIIYLTNLPLPTLSTGFTPPLNPSAIASLGVIVFVAMVTTLTIGIMAGVLAGDVRGGQQLAGLIEMPLLLFPYLLLQFSDIANLPQPFSTILLLNPFSHMLLAIRAVFEEGYGAVALHTTVMGVFMAAILGLAAWLFRGERLLTMRVTLKRSSQRS